MVQDHKTSTPSIFHYSSSWGSTPLQYVLHMNVLNLYIIMEPRVTRKHRAIHF